LPETINFLFSAIHVDANHCAPVTITINIHPGKTDQLAKWIENLLLKL